MHPRAKELDGMRNKNPLSPFYFKQIEPRRDNSAPARSTRRTKVDTRFPGNTLPSFERLGPSGGKK